jgi:hypothetical protein
MPELQGEDVMPESSVGTASGYRLDDQGVEIRVPLGLRIVTSSYRPIRLWGPPNLPFNGSRWLFPEV